MARRLIGQSPEPWALAAFAMFGRRRDATAPLSTACSTGRPAARLQIRGWFAPHYSIMLTSMVRTGDSYDVFLSHASEDKEEVVVPLAKALEARGVRVWLDRQQLTLGDSLSRKIDEGLAQSRFGAVVLSPAFFAKSWPIRELDGLVARETSLGVKVILPIWHGVAHDEILEFSPTLAGKLAARTVDGLDAVVDQILEVLGGPIDAGQVVANWPESALGEPGAGSPESDPSISIGAMVRAAVVEQRVPELRGEIAKYSTDAKDALVSAGAQDFGASLEPIAALAGALSLFAPQDSVTDLAVTAPHRIFDAAHDAPPAWQIADGTVGAWPSMLATVRAIGALLIRLELWPQVRMLAGHPPPPGSSQIYSGWLCWMEVQIARRRSTPNNAEHFRQPLRDAAALIARVQELSGDGPNENARLNSVIAFDFVSRLVEADGALRAGRPTEAFPNFAHFDVSAVRPFARRVAEGGALARELLPDRSVDDVLALLGIVDAQARAAATQYGFWDGIADSDLQRSIAARAARG
jgi:hypothetical protein